MEHSRRPSVRLRAERRRSPFGHAKLLGGCTFQATVSDSSGNIYTRNYMVNAIGVPPTIFQIGNTDTYDEWTVGQRAYYTFSASGGVPPYSWSATGLPRAPPSATACSIGTLDR